MVKAAVKICSAILFPLWWLCFPCIGNAQEIIEELTTDTVEVAQPDSLPQTILIISDSNFVAVPEVSKEAFKPNSTKALLFAIIPGMGQIYNRKYWKLPIVYGGFMGCMYAITWNNKMYRDFTGIYESMVQDAYAYRKELEGGDADAIANFEFNKKWTDLLGTENAATNVLNTTYHERFKSRKNYYRKYRDLSIIITIGVYALSLIDAYVDAELFDFDISQDLSMRVEPVYTPQTSYSSRTVGLSCSLTF